MATKVTRLRKNRQRARKRESAPAATDSLNDVREVMHHVDRALLESSVFLNEIAESRGSPFSNAAAWAIRAVREAYLSGDLSTLNKIGGYKRSEHLRDLVQECDAIIGAHQNERRLAVRMAVSYALEETPNVLRGEICRGVGDWHAQPHHAAAVLADELLRHAETARYVDGQSVVRTALRGWGLSSDRATDLLKFLSDKRPRKNGSRGT